MLFHYIAGSLMCEIRIPGLTHNVNGWTVHNWWNDHPTDLDIVDCADAYYGGFDHFVCESLSRKAAQQIVTALGGYLVDDFYIPVGRQLGDGGPFFMHQFDLYSPRSLGRVNSIEAAAGFIQSEGRMAGIYRIYDASGYMVIEIRKD